MVIEGIMTLGDLAGDVIAELLGFFRNPYCAIIGVVALIGIVGSSTERIRVFLRFRRNKMTPAIGYKKAYVKNIEFSNDKSEITDIMFSGIATLAKYGSKDTTYAFNESEDQPKGFHMYDSYRNACVHQQGGPESVILEVLGFGKMVELDKGTITSEQRVLQMIVKCRRKNCEKTPRYCLIPRNSLSVYHFACAKHSVKFDRDERRIPILPLLNKTHYVSLNSFDDTGEKVPLTVGVETGEGSVQPFVQTRLPD